MTIPHHIRHRLALLLALAPVWLALGALPAPAVAQKASVLGNGQSVLAMVGQEPIRLDDVQDREIHELRERLHAALAQRVHRAAVERLARRYPGFSLQPAAPVTEAEAREFYTRNGLESRGTFEQMQERIERFLTERNAKAHLQRQFDDAVRRGLVVSRLRPPEEYLVTVPVASAYLWGPAEARVMLLEFSDFQCPYCEKVQSTLEKLRQTYGNRVAFAYRHFPLPFHTEAGEAALAAECAREQGRFEPYHALLFRNRARQYIPDLKRYAREVDMPDANAFDACLTDKKYAQRLDADIAAGVKIGVSGTPSFVVGTFDRRSNSVRGELFSGALPEQDFVAHLEKYLSRARAE